MTFRDFAESRPLDSSLEIQIRESWHLNKALQIRRELTCGSREQMDVYESLDIPADQDFLDASN